MAQSKLSHVERCAGKRASFKVWYIRKGRRYFDVMWAPGTDEARAKFLAFAKELKWKVEVTAVERIDPEETTRLVNPHGRHKRQRSSEPS